MSGPRPIRPTSGGGAGLTPSQEGNLNANTAARHTHTNKAILDATEEAFTTAILNNINQKVDSDGLKQLSTEDYTTAEKNKLGNITDSFKGFFADAVARDAAIITPTSGFYVIQDDTDSVWFYDGAAWVNTESTATGDMLKAVYDPTSVNSDAFSMGSMVETASEKVFTLAERTKLAGLIPIDQPTIDRIPAQEVVIGTGATEIPTNSILASKGANYGRNLIINGDFSVNQRAVSGTVALSAGEYGHDRFKAGSGGCTYTFATSLGVTTITITAGTLLQVIEGQNLPSKTVVLSWAGTAQGRIGFGSYGSSGSVTDTLAGGSNISVEFNTGTLTNAQLEFGGTSTEFEHVHSADQLARCQRYYVRYGSTTTPVGIGSVFTTNVGHAVVVFPASMRGEPAFSMSGAGDFDFYQNGVVITGASAVTMEGQTASNAELRFVATMTVNQPVLIRCHSGWFAFSAEL